MASRYEPWDEDVNSKLDLSGNYKSHSLNQKHPYLISTMIKCFLSNIHTHTQYLLQGYCDMWTSRARDWSTKPLVGRWPALPPELHHICNACILFLQGSLCKDIAISCCCCTCSWCQMHRELKHRKQAPTVINIQNNNIVNMQPFPVMQAPMMMPSQPVPAAYMAQPGVAAVSQWRNPSLCWCFYQWYETMKSFWIESIVKYFYQLPNNHKNYI